jgi:hypothetical protein
MMLAEPVSPSWKRFLRFGVRGLFVFVLVIGAGLRWIVHQARIQRASSLLLSGISVFRFRLKSKPSGPARSTSSMIVPETGSRGSIVSSWQTPTMGSCPSRLTRQMGHYSSASPKESPCIKPTRARPNLAIHSRPSQSPIASGFIRIFWPAYYLPSMISLISSSGVFNSSRDSLTFLSISGFKSSAQRRSYS